MPAAILRPASLVSDRAMTQNVISPGRNVATPAARLISSHWGGRIDDTETRFCSSMSASRSAYSNAVRAWRCTPTPWVRNTLLGNGKIVPSTFYLDSRTQRCKPLSRASFFPCLIPQHACDSVVQRLGENEADSRRVEALYGVIACPAIYTCCLEERRGRRTRISHAQAPIKVRDEHGHGGHQHRHR